jgi:phage terminase large subunit-like protein
MTAPAIDHTYVRPFSWNAMLAEAVTGGADQLVVAESGIDPIGRLMDPAFTDPLWEYEGSRLGTPLIPGQLHPKQVEQLMSPAKHRLLFWGNQSGKSSFGAVDEVLTGLGRHPVNSLRWKPPIVQWASALTWELWENILLPELLTWIPPWRIIKAPEPYQHSLNRHIVFRADNGAVSRITGKAAEQGRMKYQSARVHQVWFDEEHPQEIWDECQPRLLRFNGRSLSTLTPLKGLTWMYHRIYEPHYLRGKGMAAA